MSRKIEVIQAERKAIPLNIGLWGASGCGKTYTALRLATGIQRVFPGDIIFIDTENGRGKHYADMFNYKYIAFEPPFNSLDYLDILEQVEKLKPSVIIVDSFSHEHSGNSGYLETQSKKSIELAGKWNTTPEKTTMPAWAFVSAQRKKLLRHMVRMDANIITCFRAKEKNAPSKKPNGKMTIENLGYMPEAGKEFVFEMTLSALLPPGSNGFPVFQTGNKGEDLMTKLPEQFKKIFSNGNVQLTEDVGEKLSIWAKGDSLTPAQPKTPVTKTAPVFRPQELTILEDYLTAGTIPNIQVTIGKEKVNLQDKTIRAIKYLKGLEGEFNNKTKGYTDILTVIDLIERSQGMPEDLKADSQGDELDIF